MSAQRSHEAPVVRCRFCTTKADFRPMIAYKEGRFVCPDCSHQERPEEPLYRCSCPRCLKLVMGLSSIALGNAKSRADFTGRQARQR